MYFCFKVVLEQDSGLYSAPKCLGFFVLLRCHSLFRALKFTAQCTLSIKIYFMISLRKRQPEQKRAQSPSYSLV